MSHRLQRSSPLILDGPWAVERALCISAHLSEREETLETSTVQRFSFSPFFFFFPGLDFYPSKSFYDTD